MIWKALRWSIKSKLFFLSSKKCAKKEQILVTLGISKFGTISLCQNLAIQQFNKVLLEINRFFLFFFLIKKKITTKSSF